MKKKVITVKLNKEFKRAYYQGGFKAHPLLVTYLIKNRSAYSRIGITTAKKIGGAVARNRARRIIKQAYRELYFDEGLTQINGCDLIFVARSDTPFSNTREIKKVMKKQIESLLKHGKQGKNQWQKKK